MFSEGIGSRTPSRIPNFVDAQVPYVKCLQFSKLSVFEDSTSVGGVEPNCRCKFKPRLKGGLTAQTPARRARKRLGWQGSSSPLRLKLTNNQGLLQTVSQTWPCEVKPRENTGCFQPNGREEKSPYYSDLLDAQLAGRQRILRVSFQCTRRTDVSRENVVISSVRQRTLF